MKIYKIAQNIPDNTTDKPLEPYQINELNQKNEAEALRKQQEKRNKALKMIFDALPGNSNKADRITSYAKELPFYDVFGQAYLAISFNTPKDSMRIEKYYDSEFLQDEYGTVKTIPINWDNPQDTINKILSIIQTWVNLKKASANQNMTKYANLTRKEIVDRITTWNQYLKNEKNLAVIRTIKETLNTLQDMLTLVDSLNMPRPDVL